MADPEFDLLVYGASGFTGRLVAEYLLQAYPAGEVRWAMAGRDEAKLGEVRDELGGDVPIVAADANDPAALDAMVRRTRAVVTTVGPYQLYGEPLVAACANAGTDYLDLCGEPAWMRAMIDRYDAAAKASGARILFSCGFDSIPSELGVFTLQALAQRDLGGPVPRVKARVRTMKGGFSGGTAASLQATMAAAAKDPQVLALLRDPFSLTPGFTGPPQPRGNKAEYEGDLESWVGPFVMAAINTRNVHRSNLLQGHPWGADLVYDEMAVTGPGDRGEKVAKSLAEGDGGLGGPNAPKPGEGPDRAERESGAWDILFTGEAADGRQVRVSVAGDRDPGYGSTSKMLAETALCLLASDAKPGVWTPGAALGQALVDRLAAKAGVTFRVEG